MCLSFFLHSSLKEIKIIKHKVFFDHQMVVFYT